MTGFGMVPDELLPAALLALEEGRLAWRVTDAHGRACNGGDAEPLPIGAWSQQIANPVVCERGWHTTDAPHRYVGARVWLVEGDGSVAICGDKRAWSRVRPLAEVNPRRCLDACAYVRCSPSLDGANLDGANLDGANLDGASLDGAMWPTGQPVPAGWARDVSGRLVRVEVVVRRARGRRGTRAPADRGDAPAARGRRGGAAARGARVEPGRGAPGPARGERR